jgi:hypothetical protein
MLGEVCPAQMHTPLRGTNRFARDTMMPAWKIYGECFHLLFSQQVAMIDTVILTKVRLAEGAGRTFRFVFGSA